MRPTVYVIAGPNGAGKTTFAMQYLPSLGNCRMFLNADLIAAAMSPFAPEKEGAKAGRFLLTRVRELVEARESFALETTLAGKSYARLFLQMKAQGYRVVLYFFWLPVADMAVSRVANRVRQGGHDVPEKDIRRRYQAGRTNFGKLYEPIADEWWLIANGHFPPREIARKSDEHVLVADYDLYDGFLTNNQEYQNMQSDPSDPTDSDKVLAALGLASLRALVVASETDTPVIVWQDGKIQEILPDQVDLSGLRLVQPSTIAEVKARISKSTESPS